jgi:hypothetical protein
MSNLTHYQPRNSDEQAIITARSNRIANLDQKDAYKQTLNVISSVFPMYGIDGDLSFYANIAKEIVKTFGQIAANEIEIAFRLFSASALELDDDIKFYGKANMHTIGKIINGYMVYRRKIIASHDNEVAALRHQKDMEERGQKEREKIYAEFPTMIKDFAGKTWEDVPLYWYDLCIKFNMIDYEEGEKRALWEEAQAIALKEPAESLDLMTIRSHAKVIEQGNMKRAVVIAQKLAVWRKVIKKQK